MADQVQAVRVLGGDNGQGGVLLDAMTGIDQPGLLARDRDAATQRRLGQTGADGLGNLGDRDGAGELTLRAIGQSDL